MNQKNLLEVDWSKIPAPTDDGAAAHLVGHDDSADRPGRDRRYLGDAVGAAGAHRGVRLSPDRRARQDLAGRRLGHDPGRARLHAADLRVPRPVRRAEGRRRAQVFGLSTQSNAYQTEMASRLHLPFPVLSDEKLG